jgi:hypothetical protein
MHLPDVSAPGNSRLIEIPKGSTDGRPALQVIIMERIAVGISWERERNSVERERRHSRRPLFRPCMLYQGQMWSTTLLATSPKQKINNIYQVGDDSLVSSTSFSSYRFLYFSFRVPLELFRSVTRPFSLVDLKSIRVESDESLDGPANATVTQDPTSGTTWSRNSRRTNFFRESTDVYLLLFAGQTNCNRTYILGLTL